MPPPKGHGADVMMLIGQLLEATQAASEGLKNTNVEIQANGKAIIVAVKTLELISETVDELDRLVRTGNGDSIITRLAILRAEVIDLQKQVADLEERVRTTSSEVRDLDDVRKAATSGKNAIWEIGKMIGWIITTIIAVYAAVKGSS